LYFDAETNSFYEGTGYDSKRKKGEGYYTLHSNNGEDKAEVDADEARGLG